MISNSFLSKKRAPNLVMTGVKTLGFFMNVSERNTRSVKIGMLERTTAIEMAEQRLRQKQRHFG
jgi:hydroxymethylpyrimidine/phosphomethylpyrimidine kinase